MIWTTGGQYRNDQDMSDIHIFLWIFSLFTILVGFLFVTALFLGAVLLGFVIGGIAAAFKKIVSRKS